MMVVLIAAGLWLRARVDQVLQTAHDEIEQKKTNRLTFRVIVPQSRPGYTFWSSIPRVLDIRLFRDRLYVAGNLGLQEFDPTGRLIRTIGALEGLPSSRITALAQTPEALWAGVSPHGLLRFDGERFEYFSGEDPGDLEITALHPLSSGELLIGTKRKGVLRFQSSVATSFSSTLDSQFITCLHETPRQLAIGTFDSGLYLYRQGILAHLDKATGLVDDQVTALAAEDETLFVGTPLGISEVREAQVTRQLAPGALVRALATREGLISAGTAEGILSVPRRPVSNPLSKPGIRQDAAAAAWMPSALAEASNPISTSRPERAVNALFPWEDGWLVATDLGLYQVGSQRGKSWQAWGTRTSELAEQHAQIEEGAHADRQAPVRKLSDSNVSAIAVDSQSRRWVGFFDRGLDIVDASGRLLQHYEDDRLFCINHIQPISGDRTLVATTNGLAIFAGTRLVSFLTDQDGLIHRSVSMTLPWSEDSQSFLATTAEGISFLQGGRPARNFYALHGLANNRVYTATQMGKRLYLGTLGGISVMENSRVLFSWTSANSGLRANWVNALVGSGDRLYVGTYGGGVQCVEAGGRWVDFSTRIGAFEVNPNAMVMAQGLLYVGTLDRGFYVYDVARDRWRQVRERLPSLNVTGFAPVSDRLLVATDNGVVEIELNELSDL
ncbi:MAG: hypothetical protein AB1898_01695 [Acidobacteriota bacterium]